MFTDNDEGWAFLGTPPTTRLDREKVARGNTGSLLHITPATAGA